MGNFGIVLGKYWSIVRMLAFISCLDFTTASDSLTFSTPRNNVQPQCICQDPTKAIHNSPLRLSGFRDSITVRDSVMICSEENAFIKKIRFAMNPVEDFAVITVNHDPSILNMSIIVNEDFDKDYVKIFKGERSIETRERSQYAIVKPSSCRQKCLVSILLSSSSKYFSGYNALQVTSKGSKSICPSLDYELSVNLGRMLSVGGRIKSSVVMGKVKRFGVEISEKYHSILVQLTPNQRIRNMDVDLFIYNETNIFDFIFPNSDPHNRNHVRNSPELALISFQHSSSTSGFYLIHVHAPTETSQDINTFQLDILPNRTNYHLYFSLFAPIIGTGITFGLFIVLLLFLLKGQFPTYLLLRERVLEQRTGASTDEIDAIPELKFDLNLNERWGNDINCAVCLDEYVVGDLLKQLDCGHHFHKACIDPWLKKSRICPLCKQTFNQAVNMKKVESVEIQLNNHL